MSSMGVCFKRVDLSLGDLLTYVDIGDIGLPDIQRPFVWSNTKIRDLFDSMYRGFPVGYLLFWRNTSILGVKQIGVGHKEHRVPSLLIVDGQQRLTSLFAVFRARKVLDENYVERHIEIAFRPRDGRFEVADAAIRKDPEFIPSISELWASGKSSRKLVNDFIQALSTRAPLSDVEEELISHNLDRLFDLQKYPFTALEIAETVNEEQVADIFVRINSEGVKLNQADFLLTLLSVFWEEGRVALETFSRTSRIPPAPGGPPSSFNHFIKPGPDQLLRVAVAVGFRRARLKSAYQVLRGKDIETDTYRPERRDQQFALLQEAQSRVLNLTHWHQFLNSLVGAGFRGHELITSENALLYTYAFYLLGRTEYAVPEVDLQRLIGSWFFASSLTGRYTNSPESAMDSDLNRLPDRSRLEAGSHAAAFSTALERILQGTLTSDYWSITLPGQLESSSTRSPALMAYHATQNRLGAPVLFSQRKVSELLDPMIKMKKKALDLHHLFPRAMLERQGITDLKLINQVANYALIEWPDNIDISDAPPAEYVPEMRKRFNSEDWNRMCELHALPDGWESMGYEDFLAQRRLLMAGIIRRGFEAIMR